ncbi:hypothetical protein CATMIT_00845 [Catenibacterium mitsuokai DSM 15897]|uniref:hypothetical protein n=1 Tax=Catenibacterium mitsuokai TaxID=100886 RepID=UPI000196A9EC|nr:hypothetical protein [Catenibacterium mitsuokai]EEF94495.1 hypothetical protein CATMIT_00845 [Catenibacterium mitsuokai DSM 15897]UWO54351.1 hypothetical protein NQ499_05835 [Catenibacterium mitsuokai]
MIQVNIDEKKVDNFTDQACYTLKEQMGKYADNIIKESNLIEESIREDGANAEITSTIVMQAIRKSKSDTRKKSSNRLIILKIASTISTLITGFLFDASGYGHNFMKLICFIICLIIASVSTAFQIILEEKE